MYKYRTTSEIIFDLLIQDFTIQNFRDKVSVWVAKWVSTDTAVCCRKPHVLCGSYVLGSADHCQSNAKSMLQRMFCKLKGSVARVRRAALARRLAASVTEGRGHGPLMSLINRRGPCHISLHRARLPTSATADERNGGNLVILDAISRYLQDHDSSVSILTSLARTLM